jgi:hypothetical protein
MFQQNFKLIQGPMWVVLLCKVVMTKVYIEKTSKQIFEMEQYNLGEFEKSLKIGKRKYIIKTCIQKFGM